MIILKILLMHALASEGFAYSCISSPSNKWRLCDPGLYQSSARDCRCHHIVVNNRGDSDCYSRDKNKPFCYVAGGSSSCDDLGVSSHNPTFSDWWNETINYSEKACEKENNETEIGNEPILHGIELIDDDQNFLSTSISKSALECQAECQKRFKCRSWVFLEGSPATCSLRGQSTCCNQFANRIENPLATSGYECVKDTPDFVAFWSTTGPCPKPEEKTVPDVPESGCPKSDEITWSVDGKCYSLLDQGPCKDDEWFVLKDDFEDDSVDGVCKKLPCMLNNETASCVEDFTPECEENLEIIYNLHGQPICACPEKHYQVEETERWNKRCYKQGDLVPDQCEGKKLYLLDESGFWMCSDSDDSIVPLCSVCDLPSARCPQGQVYIFKACRKRRAGR